MRVEAIEAECVDDDATFDSGGFLVALGIELPADTYEQEDVSAARVTEGSVWRTDT